MKYLGLFLFVTIVPGFLHSQSELTFKHSAAYGLEIEQLKNTARMHSCINFSWVLEAHRIGPSILFTTRSNHPQNVSWWIPSGFGLDYKYIMPSPIRSLEFCAVMNLRYQIYENIWNANYLSTSNQYIDVATSSVEHFTAVKGGYGLQWKVTPKLMVENTVQAGGFRSYLHSGRLVSESKSPKSTVHHDFRRYGNYGWTYSVSIGLRYLL